MSLLLEAGCLDSQLYVDGQYSKWETGLGLVNGIQVYRLYDLIKSTLGLLISLCQMRGPSNIYTLSSTKTLTSGVVSRQVLATQRWVLRL